MVDKPTAFLAWSREARESESLTLALQTVRGEVKARGYRLHDWSQHLDIRNIGAKIQDLIGESDIVIIEASSDQPNVAFEAGFARARHIPLVVLKRQSSGPLPEDLGAPQYLDYPDDVNDEVGFRDFKAHFDRLLTELEQTVLSPGQRAVRRSRDAFLMGVTSFVAAYRHDHPHLYLLSGWIDGLASEIGEAGPTRLSVDAGYYLPAFDKLRLWDSGRIRAIADLTDDTEPFWTPEHADAMSVSERIFVIDWRQFFGDEERLTRSVDQWRRHKAMQGDRSYEIYVATDDGREERHPLGASAVGRHLLLLEPDTSGGYRREPEARRSLFVSERGDRGYAAGERYYQLMRDRAVRFDPSYHPLDLKRAWIERNRLGYWDPHWNHDVEDRDARYFTHFDRHIRCWIPSYDQMLRETAFAVEKEVLRIRQRTSRSLSLLEMGFGTGNLTVRLMRSVRVQNAPFTEPNESAPISSYVGVDRAPQMVQRARQVVGGDIRHVHLHPHVRLYEGRVWYDVPETDRYDIICGSLVLHFLMGPDPLANQLDEFFVQCGERLREDGSVVIADAVRPESDADARQSIDRWRGWMVRNGLSEEYADAYLKGNSDMVRAATVRDLEDAARRNGFVNDRRKPIGDARLPFRILSFHKES